MASGEMLGRLVRYVNQRVDDEGADESYCVDHDRCFVDQSPRPSILPMEEKGGQQRECLAKRQRALVDSRLACGLGIAEHAHHQQKAEDNEDDADDDVSD